MGTRRDNDLVEMRVVRDHGRGGRFDEVGDVRVGKMGADAVDGWCGEDDVTDLPETY